MPEFKLSYTASEINNKLDKIDSLAEKSELPTKTSELINDSDFATKSYVNGQVIAIPSVNTSDNGKFLCVINGVWTATAIPNAEDVSF